VKKPEDISDAEAAQALADPAEHAEILAFLAEHNVSMPPEQLPSDALKAAIADIHNRKTQSTAKADNDTVAAVSPDDITDDMVARALQNNEMRRALEALLKSTGHDDPLDLAPQAILKLAVAAIIQHAQSQQFETDNITPDQISEKMLDAALANDQMRAALSSALKMQGVEQPLDQVPREIIKAAFAAMAAIAQQRQQQKSPERPQIPDRLVAQIFADPRGDGVLRDVMRQNNLEGEPQDLPDGIKRQIVEVLVQQGVINFGEDRDA